MSSDHPFVVGGKPALKRTNSADPKTFGQAGENLVFVGCHTGAGLRRSMGATA